MKKLSAELEKYKSIYSTLEQMAKEQICFSVFISYVRVIIVRHYLSVFDGKLVGWMKLFVKCTPMFADRVDVSYEINPPNRLRTLGGKLFTLFRRINFLIEF